MSGQPAHELKLHKWGSEAPQKTSKFTAQIPQTLRTLLHQLNPYFPAFGSAKSFQGEIQAQVTQVLQPPFSLNK